MDCSKCIFAVTEDRQTGCKADRLHKLIDKERATLEESHYKLSQFCNMYRTEEWDGGDEPVSKARDEISVGFGVAIFDDLSGTSDNIRKTLDSIIKAIDNYDNKRVQVVFSLGVGMKSTEVVELVNYGQSKGVYCEAIVHRFLYEDRHRETECFQKLAHMGYLTMIKGGSEIKESTFTEIDKRINDDLEQIVCFQSNDVILVHSNLARSEYFNFKNFQDMTSSVKEFCSTKGVLGLI